jgi:hypothetical protein
MEISPALQRCMAKRLLTKGTTSANTLYNQLAFSSSSSSSVKLREELKRTKCVSRPVRVDDSDESDGEWESEEKEKEQEEDDETKTNISFMNLPASSGRLPL